MPPVLAAIAAASSAIGAALATTLPFIGLTVGQAIVGSYLIYGVVKQRRMERAARNSYNDGLVDRTVTYSDANAPWQIIYGQVPVVGGRVVAQLKSGSRDEFQHVVVVWADHECYAIDDVMLNGVSLGTLDGNGYVTGGKYFKASTSAPTATVTLNGSGAGTLPVAPEAVLGMSWTTSNEGGVIEEFLTPAQLTLSGSTVTVSGGLAATWAGRMVQVTYRSGSTTSMVRVRHHLGAAGQTADASLLSECPSDWSSTDVLADKCYSVFRFSLDEPEFQGGPPRMTAAIRGKKVLNHRSGATTFSQNVSDCLADFLMAPYGKNQPSNAIIWAAQEAAANACDESITVNVGGTPTTGPRFTCNGAFTTDADPDETLTALCQAMAGFATFTGGAWHIQAGVFTVPVATLTDADNAGPVELLPTPEGQQMFNGMRGQFYDPARFGQRTDYTPYKNTAFVTADGGEDFGNLNLPFTSAGWRCTNLARIQVERSRATQLLYPAKMSALRRRVGERLYVSGELLNLDLEIFRLAKKEWRLGGPVMLTLVQDDASMYDEIDAPAPLASPTAPAVDPWVVPALAGWAVESNTGIAVFDANGSVISRVRATWTPPTNPYLVTGGSLQVEYRLATASAWTRLPDLNPNAGTAALQGFEYLRAYVLRARFCNALGAVSDWQTRALETGVRPAIDERSGFSAVRAWNFSGSVEGWTVGDFVGSGSTLTVAGPASVVHDCNATDAYIQSPGSLGISGTGNRRVRMRLQRTAGSGWYGLLYYTTTGHGIGSTYFQQALNAPPANNVWTVIEWDMTTLPDGSSDWVSSTVQQLLMQLGRSAADTFEIDWIAVGALTPGSYGAAFGVNISGQAQTTDLAANAATKVHTASASNITVDGMTGVPTGDFTTLISYTFTPTVDCDVVLSAEGSASISTGSSAGASGNGVFAVLSTHLTVNGTQIGALRNYAISQVIGLNANATAQIARAQRFTATGGVSYTVVLEAQKLFAATSTIVNDVAMRLEEIRR